LTTQPIIQDSSQPNQQKILTELIGQISTLASVYHRLPSTFVPKMANSEQRIQAQPTIVAPKLQTPDPTPPVFPGTGPGLLPIGGSPQLPPGGTSGVLDLLGLGSFGSSATPAPVPLVIPLMPVATIPAPVAAVPVPVKTTMTLVQRSDNPNSAGLQIEAMFVMHENAVKLRMILTNQSAVVLDRFLMKFGANTFRAFPSVQQLAVQPIQPGGQGKVSVPLVFGKIEKEETGVDITIAIKSALGVSTFVCVLPIHISFIASGPVSRDVYKQNWEAFGNQKYFPVTAISRDPNTIKQQLSNSNIFFMAQRIKDDSTLLYLSANMADETLVLLEVEISPSGLQLCINTNQASYVPLIFSSITAILNSE